MKTFKLKNGDTLRTPKENIVLEMNYQGISITVIKSVTHLVFYKCKEGTYDYFFAGTVQNDENIPQINTICEYETAHNEIIKRLKEKGTLKND